VGRRALTLADQHFNTAAECTRCDRHLERFGVVASRWSVRPRVLVIEVAAARELQAFALRADATADSPRMQAFVDDIAHAFGLRQGEVISDVLLACGPSGPARSGDVAACAGRFLANVIAVGAPDVVALVGGGAWRLAAGAGVADKSRWKIIGMSESRPLVVLEQARLDARAVALLEEHLGIRARLSSRSFGPQAAFRLRRVLGRANGRAVLGIRGAWRRQVDRPLTTRLCERHLAGSLVVAPFRPVGPWPYVVIDIDRHNAVQAIHFAQTVERLRTLFPNSIFMQSSASGGVHAYVPLPPHWRYDDAARILEAYLVVEGLHTIDEPVKFKEREHLFRAVVAEVPRHPVRLPFGRGSRLLDAADQSDEEQFTRFLKHVELGAAQDFEVAFARVKAELGLGNDLVVRRRRIDSYILGSIVGPLSRLALPADDPWRLIVGQLRRPLASVAVNGIPALGTRTGLTSALLDEVVALGLSSERTEELMLYWLHKRDHHSEDIARDVAAVERLLVEELRRRLNNRVEVPATVLHVARAMLFGPLPVDASRISGSRADVALRAVLRRFWKARESVQPVSHRLFGRRNEAAQLKLLFVRAGLLALVRPPIRGIRAAEYALNGVLAPPT
jgi:hypothetical protein